MKIFNRTKKKELTYKEILTLLREVLIKFEHTEQTDKTKKTKNT